MDSGSNRGSTGQLSSGGGSIGAGGGGVGGGGMHHSLSTPAGVDCGARTPPATPKKGGKMLAIRVQMLDDSVTIFQVQAKALGRVLFDQVCKQLHLLEADYFGLEYSDTNGTKYWLDLQKPISRQLGLSLVDPLLYFCVKFYTPDPGQLEEEYTRYLFCLQVKRDLSQGLMQCNENTAALMASYIVQAECGDYVAEDYPDHTYLSSYKFVPQQDQDMEKKIMENHKKHSGQSPAEADLNLLETARRCELYGIKMHPAKDHENVALNLAVAHMGILVFQNYTKINTFSWAKIRKISFKRKRFLIKLHPEGYGYYRDTVEFFFEGRNECKNFWKKCVENHGFFRCSSVKNVSRHKTRVLSRGSSFRYSGKTQQQIIEFVRDNYVKRQAFQRSASFRHSSAHSSATNMHSSTVGNSISAHPLLPLADSNLSVEASKLSASLGSMDGPVVPAAAAVSCPASQTTKSVCRHPDTAISWNSVHDIHPQPASTIITTEMRVQTMNLPSPPSTTIIQSSPITSPPPRHPQPDYMPERTSISIISHHQPPPPSTPPQQSISNASSVAVRAAVHRADTGTNTYTHTIPPRTTTVRTPSSHKSAGSLDRQSPTSFIDIYPIQTQSQNDVHDHIYPDANVSSECLLKRQLWQRSASCRDLYDFSFDDSGQAKRRLPGKNIKTPLIEQRANSDTRKLESPITRYDDHRAIYGANSRDNSLEIHQDIMMPDQKVYSSSYPGTMSYSQESVEDPGNYDLRDSQDDLSHDSYELLEKSDDDYTTSVDYKYRDRKSLNVRSCSLDSGNYLPSDSDSDIDKKLKCKSSTDVHHEDVIFALDDPRDFPREIIPRRSDGHFYRNYKLGSRTSSQESKSDYYESRTKSSKESLRKNEREFDYNSRTSSLESKSEYYDANGKFECSEHRRYKHDYDRKISFERNYGTQSKLKGDEQQPADTSHVYSIALQHEVDTDRSRVISQTDSSTRRSTESESNIFSFDEDKIQSLQGSLDVDQYPDQATIDAAAAKRQRILRDVFMEIEPRRGRENLPLHQPIERTKSDPNSLARQKINSNARRLLLMHQKSIDLTPAESSDDDYLYKQIPSAPPIMKYNRHFEMPSTAEFGHFDILKRQVEGEKTKFKVPKNQFEILGAKTQSDFINLPPKNDEIPYVLHKRHVMNGTATKDEKDRLESISSTHKHDEKEMKKLIEESKCQTKTEDGESFLFTQNIDLSKVNPVTLEVDKSEAPIKHLSSPKRDITHIDPALLEALNSKLSQIESDSPTSSKTDSLKSKQRQMAAIQKTKDMIIKAEFKVESKNTISTSAMITVKSEPCIVDSKIKSKDKIKTDIKPKRIIKPRMQPNKKGTKTNKTKVRITSFSSDDESLDSDDVFGSAEATPTRMEFSPPQTRKEMESILKFESERKYLQYTMSSTEVEGSPPQTRKKTEKYQHDNGLDPNNQTELRRISERSLSIPSSEDDFNLKTNEMQPVFEENENLSVVLEKCKEETEKPLDEVIEDKIIADALNIEIEREKEKLLLQAEIENDLKDLKVPSKTKITEITSPTSRRKGQSPLLFAHARLNLSEGSAVTLLQKQQATESPIPGRRAKSLDAPVIPVNRLPPLNAFSSKDDTVEEEQFTTDQTESEMDESGQLLAKSPIESLKLMDEIKESDQLIEPEKSSAQKLPDIANVKETDKERDQIVPDVTNKSKKIVKTTVQTRYSTCTQKTLKSKPMVLQSKEKVTSVKTKILQKTPKISRSMESDSIDKNKKHLSTSSSLILPEIKRTKSQEMEGTKKIPPKEKAKSLEKLELKRISSKERSRSQEESDTDIVKRKAKQQMLYETAIKQTKTIKSPVKDVLPVFPQVEEMVRERHGKLEISINTIENTNVSLEEAIIITKSPKKLDKKLTKSLELNLTGDEDVEKPMQRLGKSLDLDNRTKDVNEGNEFDFKAETISAMNKQMDEMEDLNKEQEEIHDRIILEGTTLDVWLSLEDRTKSALDNIELIKKSDDFFEERTTERSPPDKLEQQSDLPPKLNEILDSNASENDVKLMKKASATVGKFIKKKLERRRIEYAKPENPIRVTSEDESLTEVSDLNEIDVNLLVVAERNKDTLLKLGVERSRSEDTGSWITVECDEFVGVESSFEYDQNMMETPAKISFDEEEKVMKNSQVDEYGEIKKIDLLSTDVKCTKLDLLKRSSDQSKSSDTTGSWTSGEKDVSPSNQKEVDESSPSCSIAKAIGYSQTVEMLICKDHTDKCSPEGDAPRSPRSPRICELGRAFTIDEVSISQKYEESSSDDANDEIPKDKPELEIDEMKYHKSPYPFEEKWSADSELGQRLQMKITKRLSGDKGSFSSIDDSTSDRRRNGKGSLVERLSTESRNSLDTESSSGSFGVAARMAKSGDIPRELSSTWKPFPLDSSGSESFDDGLLPPDQENGRQEYFLCRDNSGDFIPLGDITDVTPTKDDTELPEDLANFPANFGYPCLTSNIGGIGLSLANSDVLTNYSTTFLSRTLSRISERSTNSEKSSLEDDSTKASTQSDSINDESMPSSNPQISLSSEGSNAHVSENEKKTPTNEIPQSIREKPNFEQIPSMNSLLQRQISDDRRTSAEMAELSMDDIEILTSERGLKLNRQGSDDTVIDEECFEQEQKEEKHSSSQESEEWPLPDIPQHGRRSLLAMHELPSSDTSQQVTQVYQPPRSALPKTFGFRGSLKSQDSEPWPSPPSSVVESCVVGSVETYYMTPPEEAYKVTVDSSTVSTYENDSFSDDNRGLDLDTEKTHTYENVATEHVSESISESLSVGASGIKIVLDNKSDNTRGSNSDEDLNISNLNDDVFTDTIDTSRHELRPPTVMRRSTASDDSSYSGKKSELKSESKKSSHSSHSEEDCTSSMVTNFDDGTVRFAYKPTRCTHSSHSEDTSIALSLSEWSNSTNTVKFQNLSSNSGTTKSSSGLKSDDNSLTDIAQSISEWSSSNSNTLKAQQSTNLQFQKLSSTTTSTNDSTLTDLIPTISEWSTSESTKTLVAQQFFSPNLNERQSVTRLGSSLEESELNIPQLDQTLIHSPKNIPSEDLAMLGSVVETPNYYRKSTERPVMIPSPVQASDGERSSSSFEQKTVHIQRYDKERQTYSQTSTERPVKVPLKLSKCSPYYSSSLSSESTPLAGGSPIHHLGKTATVPFTRKKPTTARNWLQQTKSPPSENDSTSSVDSPKTGKSERRIGHRKRRQHPGQKRRTIATTAADDEEECYHELIDFNVPFNNGRYYVETLEEGYQPDGDSQSGSDIFRMEKDDENDAMIVEGFDVTSIPPPLIEDDFEDEHALQI